MNQCRFALSVTTSIFSDYFLTNGLILSNSNNVYTLYCMSKKDIPL